MYNLCLASSDNKVDVNNLVLAGSENLVDVYNLSVLARPKTQWMHIIC